MTYPITTPAYSDLFATRVTSILRAQYLSEGSERRLPSSDSALIVSRVSTEEQAESLTQMYLHRLGQGPANGPRSTKLDILGAHNRPIVISFDNDTVRDMALSHIQHARFHFRDEGNVKLDVTRLSEGTATKRSFVLDSRLVEFLRLSR